MIMTAHLQDAPDISVTKNDRGRPFPLGRGRGNGIHARSRLGALPPTGRPILSAESYLCFSIENVQYIKQIGHTKRQK
jgi:hypothetical protein